MSEQEITLPQLKVKLPGGKVLRVPVSFETNQDVVSGFVSAAKKNSNPPSSEYFSDLADGLALKISQSAAKDAVAALQDVGAEQQQTLEKLLSNQLPADGKLADVISERLDKSIDMSLVSDLDAKIEKATREEQFLNANIASVLPETSQTSNYQLPSIENLSQEQFRAELQKQGVSDSIIDSLIPEFDRTKAAQQAQLEAVNVLDKQVLGKLSELPPIELEQVLKPAMAEALKDPVAFSEKLDVEAERLAGLKPQANEVIQGDRPLDSKVEPKLEAAIDTGNVADKAAQAAEKPAVESKAETAVEQAETFFRTSEGKFKAGKVAVMATAAAAVGGLAYAKLRSSPEEKPAAQTVDSGQVSLPAVAMSRS